MTKVLLPPTETTETEALAPANRKAPVRRLFSRLPGRRRGDRRPPLPAPTAAILSGFVAAVTGLAVTLLMVALGVLASGAGADTSHRAAALDAMRAGLLAWLLGHGSGVRTATVDVDAAPLGLTVALVGLGALHARRARRGTSARTGTGPGTAAQVIGRVAGFTLTYVVVLCAAAGLGTLLGVHFHWLRLLTGGSAVAVSAGVLGFVGPRRGVDRAHRVLPFVVLGVLRGAAAGCCVVLAGAAAVFTGAVLTSVGEFADLVRALEPTSAGAVGLLATFVLTMPNLLGLTAAVLLGPGFTFGSDTAVTATSATVGALPGWPPLAAMPASGAAPGWVLGLLAMPVLAGIAAGWLAAAGTPTGPLRRLAAATGAGALAGLVVGGWVLLSGGAVGPGRMGDVGSAAACLPVAVATLGSSALLGGCVRLLAGARASRIN